MATAASPPCIPPPLQTSYCWNYYEVECSAGERCVDVQWQQPECQPNGAQPPRDACAGSTRDRCISQVGHSWGGAKGCRTVLKQ